MPSAKALEKALRDAVKADADREMTLKSVRSTAERSLGLPAEFYKTTEAWKDRSKAIIAEEVAKLEDATSGPPVSQPDILSETPDVENDDSSELSRSPSPSSSPPAKKRKRESSTGRPKKIQKLDSDIKSSGERAGKTLQKEPSSRKTHVPSKSNTSSDLSDLSDDLATKSTCTQPTGKDSGTSDEPQADTVIRKNEAESESELSELLDDSPKPKKRGKRKENSGFSTNDIKKKDSKKKEKTTKEEVHADPNTEEIKRLQGWLVKCGIRKVWGTYLKQYSNPKAKIAHLKQMLSDVGMTGRFSAEKAKQIKDKRELKADLEAVQEGAKAWGKSTSSEGEKDEAKPKRRLARGLRNLDFLGDNDGEETD
ncbi:hypothetical protein MMC25_001414 [Agyrium rufum]|nr:hypothetical protein [Agyrium rufum]